MVTISHVWTSLASQRLGGFANVQLRAARRAPSGQTSALGPAAHVAGYCPFLCRHPRAVISALDALDEAGTP